MASHRIKNFDELATTPERRAALAVAEAGLAAIDTAAVVAAAVSVDDAGVLRIKDQSFELASYKSLRVIGFGKASCDAAAALEKALGARIGSGIVIDIKSGTCEIIETVAGTHPRPSQQNLEATKKIIELGKGLSPDDLVIVIVSGGGSALMCWPEEECTQGQKLYAEFLGAGGTIQELNTIRKHLSFLKGGGLAKLLHPATVVSLIFCDVPGDHMEDVASGPTFKDTSTIADAQRLLDAYGLSGYRLTETPKDDLYFERVHNIPLVSNGDALRAMAEAAQRQGFDATVIGAELYDDAPHAIERLKQAAPSGFAIAGGEISITVQKGGGGSGGRCSYLALAALEELGEGDLILALASDGIDNSDAAGAIADFSTLERVRARGLDIADYRTRVDSYEFFKALGDGLMVTGQTGANVSDLYLWLHR